MTPQQQALFFDRVATLLNSGLTLEQSFSLASQNGHPTFRRYLQQLSVTLTKGQALTPRSSPYFDAWTLRLIQAAEVSGSLPEVCHRLAIAAHRRQRWQKRYRTIGLAAVTIILSTLLLAVALLPVHPNWLTHPATWLAAFAVLGLAAAKLAPHTLYLLALQLPLIRKVAQLHSLLYLTELALPLRSGIPILTALELLGSHIPDRSLALHLTSATRQLQTGKPLSQTLKSKLPPIAFQMIQTGEETGHLDTALEQLAVYCETQLEKTLSQIQGLLLPLSIIAIGALVALMGIHLITSLIHLLP